MQNLPDQYNPTQFEDYCVTKFSPGHDNMYDLKNKLPYKILKHLIANNACEKVCTILDMEECIILKRLKEIEEQNKKIGV